MNSFQWNLGCFGIVEGDASTPSAESDLEDVKVRYDHPISSA